MTSGFLEFEVVHRQTVGSCGNLCTNLEMTSIKDAKVSRLIEY